MSTTTTEVTRWNLEKVDQANGRNVAKFYKIYVFQSNDTWYEMRFWGRLGTDGRYDPPVPHVNQQLAIDSASTKAYAERGKGYALRSEETFPFSGDTSKLVPLHLDRAASQERKRREELNLTDSELDSVAHEAQLILASLQDPGQGMDMNRIHALKLRFNDLAAQYERASATMTMLDVLASQRLKAVKVNA